MGYVITALAAVIFISWTTIFFMARNITGLHEDIGAIESAVTLLIETNTQNYVTVQRLEKELQRCTYMRTLAEANSQEATERAGRRTKDAYIASDTRRDEINEHIQADSSASDACGTLPDRVTELLIEAANSANRGSKDS